MKSWLKTRSDKSTCANIFLEFRLIPVLSSNEWNIIPLIIHSLLYIHYLYLYLYFYLILFTLKIMKSLPEQNSEAAAGGIFKNFANFKGKRLCWSLFFTKSRAFRPATLLKRDSYTSVFLRNLRNS